MQRGTPVGGEQGVVQHLAQQHAVRAELEPRQALRAGGLSVSVWEPLSGAPPSPWHAHRVLRLQCAARLVCGRHMRPGALLCLRLCDGRQSTQSASYPCMARSCMAVMGTMGIQ